MKLTTVFFESYIDSLIDKLPPARREIFLLSRKHYLSNKEIADQLQISENTVESQMTKAIFFMKQHVRRDYGVLLLPVLSIFAEL